MQLKGYSRGKEQQVKQHKANMKLTLLWRSSLPYRNQSIDFHRKSMDWLLYDKDLRHEILKLQIRQVI